MKQLVFLLKPTSLEIVFYFFAVIVGLVIVKFNAVLDALIAESEVGEINSIRDVFGENIEEFVSGFGTSGISATLTTLIFWSAAGAVVYIIIWALFNGFKEFYTETSQADTIVRGQGVDSKSEFRQQVGRLVFRITSVVVLVAYMILTGRLLIPLFLQLFQEGVTYFSDLYGLLQILVSILGGVLAIHVYTILARFITMRLRAYGDFSLSER